jgi:hypothetical protein
MSNAVTSATANEADEPNPEAVGIVVVNAISNGSMLTCQLVFESTRESDLARI